MKRPKTGRHFTLVCEHCWRIVEESRSVLNGPIRPTVYTCCCFCKWKD